MIKDRDLIFFADDWGRFPSTMQHIGKALARNNRIIWVGSLGLRKPKLNFSDLKRVIEKVKNFSKRCAVSDAKAPVILVNPIVFPFHDSLLVRKLNNILMKRKLLNAIKKYDFKNFIIITSSPVMQDLIGKLGEISSYYFCLDDYTLFEGAFKSLDYLEKQLLKKVNAVFSVSEGLKHTRIPSSGRSYFLPQGVEIEHFRKKNDDGVSLKLNLQKTVIGFFGLISEWIDVTLFTQAAKKYPEYSFLIIGRSTVDVSNFAKFSNIHYIGPVKYEQLPAYAKLMDVGLIPFKINKLTVAANPLKLLEYMSLGLPVVSTNLPEVKKFSDYAFVAMNNDQFIEFIKKAVNMNNREAAKLRIQLSEKYSWESIAEGIFEKMSSSDIS
jgi:glycosyltransferase involved in cell wall biosynthesis